MGFFDKLLGAANKVNDIKTDIELPTEGRLARADKVASGAIKTVGHVVGVRRRSADGSDYRDLTIEIGTGDSSQRFGVQIGAGAIHRLRLGVEVPLVGGGTGRYVLDTDSISALSGVSTAFGQRLMKPFSEGVADKALDARVDHRLKKGTPARCVVTSVAPKTVLGMSATSWHITGQITG
jgi:hypothetical protein